jgi:hypothetical protein
MMWLSEICITAMIETEHLVCDSVVKPLKADASGCAAVKPLRHCGCCLSCVCCRPRLSAMAPVDEEDRLFTPRYANGAPGLNRVSVDRGRASPRGSFNRMGGPSLDGPRGMDRGGRLLPGRGSGAGGDGYYGGGGDGEDLEAAADGGHAGLRHRRGLGQLAAGRPAGSPRGTHSRRAIVPVDDDEV